MKINWVEVMGVIATLFVFIGFTQSDTTRIRVLNSIGSALFVVYGIFLGALSVWLLNGACLLLNIYKIIKEESVLIIRKPSSEIVRTCKGSEKINSKNFDK